VEADVESLSYTSARWLAGPPEQVGALSSGAGTRLVNDRHGRPVMLFESEWALEYAQRQNPDVKFLAFHQD
jgi:peptide subunit release factor RF-3